jgi:hypothetical protein
MHSTHPATEIMFSEQDRMNRERASSAQAARFATAPLVIGAIEDLRSITSGGAITAFGITYRFSAADVSTHDVRRRNPA